MLRNKSYSMAVLVVGLAKEMTNSYEYVLSRQLLKSGTCVGAMIREAQYAESTQDFRHKFLIALKEANETDYWLDLISDTYPQWQPSALDIKTVCKEILAMLIATTKTLKGSK